MKNIYSLLIVLLISCAGKSGDMGSEGTQGPEGPVGPIGPQGPQGPAGPQGIQGPQGQQGVQGPKGDTGNTGPQGAQGIQGMTGAPGPIGPQGPQGQPGAQGATGPQGMVGPAGATGSQGPAGPMVQVLDSSGNQLGVVVPWRTVSGATDVAIFAHQSNPSSTFPQGWVIPLHQEFVIYYTGSSCNGNAEIINNGSIPNNYIYDLGNILFYSKGFTVLYKHDRTLQTAQPNSFRSTADGICMTGSTNSPSYIALADSGYRMDISTTLPWTMVIQ